MALPNQDEAQLPSTLAQLPAIFQIAATDHVGLEGPFIAFLRSYEEITGKIDAEIDALPAYFDPATTPAIFIPPWYEALAWLGAWVGVDVGDVEFKESPADAEADIANATPREWSREKKQRQLVKNAAALWTRRGTPQGLIDILDAFFDVQVEIKECTWPQGMQIEQASTIGIDTALIPDADLKHSFVVVWDPSDPLNTSSSNGTPTTQSATSAEWRLPLRRLHPAGSRGSLAVEDPTNSQALSADAFRIKVQKIRRALDRERPAHTNCFLAFGLEETTETTEPMEMQIGVHSRVGASVLPEPKE